MVIKGHCTLTPVTQWGMENIPIDIRVFLEIFRSGGRLIKRHAMGLTNNQSALTYGIRLENHGCLFLYAAFKLRRWGAKIAVKGGGRIPPLGPV